MISADLRPRLEFGLKAFLIVAFGAVLVAGARELETAAREASVSSVDLGAWTVTHRPDWLTLEDARRLCADTGLVGWGGNPLDPRCGPEVEAALLRAPLVDRVVTLRRGGPGRIEAWLELRAPAAAVRLFGPPERFVEVDAEGVVLGPPLPEPPERGGRVLPIVAGAASVEGRPQPAPGARLGDEVRAAAALAEELRDFAATPAGEPLRALREIEVSNFGGRLRAGRCEIVLRTLEPHGGDLEWGRADAREPHEGEPPFGQKAARAALALRLYPGLVGVRTVRVAFADLVVVPAERASPPADPRGL